MKTKFAVLLAAVTLSTAQGAIIFTTEAAGVQQTSVQGVLTETFNVLPTGDLGIYSSVIGTYSMGARIVSPNAFGGANQSNYAATGNQSNTTTYSLSFAAPQSFFGLYWQAADVLNQIQFFNGANLVASFQSGEVFNGLGAAYFGNPNTGQNTGERYAYINFIATNASAFDRIVFNNNGLVTGFETDNHSILAPKPNVPQTATDPVPEPATYFLTGAACIAVALYRRR
jgi:hypothetical protein